MVLGDMLGLAKEAPSRLKMDDYRDLGLESVTNSGLSYSTHRLTDSAQAPVTSVKPHQSRKRALSPSPLGLESPTKTFRVYQD
jgi:hypothetical protein